MIENEQQLRHAIETIARMYAQSEREATEPAWDAQTRLELSEDTDAVRTGIEQEVARFLAEKYGFVSTLPRVREKAIRE